MINVLMQLACGVLSAGAEPTNAIVPKPDLTITTTGECAKARYEITGPTSLTTHFPQAGCTIGLVVLQADAGTTWDGSTRILTLRMRIRNTTSQPIALPVRLELPVNGKGIVTPDGTSIDSIVPLNMDSTLADDRKLWLLGGTGTLPPNTPSVVRSLTFLVKAPVTQGWFKFVSQGEEISDTTWQVLSGVPALDTTKVVQRPGDTAKLYRTEAILRFNASVSAAAKAAFFATNHLTVLVDCTR